MRDVISLLALRLRTPVPSRGGPLDQAGQRATVKRCPPRAGSAPPTSPPCARDDAAHQGKAQAAASDLAGGRFGPAPERLEQVLLLAAGMPRPWSSTSSREREPGPLPIADRAHARPGGLRPRTSPRSRRGCAPPGPGRGRRPGPGPGLSLLRAPPGTTLPPRSGAAAIRASSITAPHGHRLAAVGGAGPCSCPRSPGSAR